MKPDNVQNGGDKKKKALLVTRNFPPLIGGMEKLNLKVSDALSKKFSVFIAGPVGSGGYHKFKFVEFPFKPLWRYIFSSFFKTAFFSIKIKPDLVLCGSGAAILAGYIAAKMNSAKLVCYLHGLDIIAPSKVYQFVFLPVIRRSDLIIVNSHHTSRLATSAKIASHKINILCPGVEFPDRKNKEELIVSFREKYYLGSRPFLLIAGRITARKGIAEFIREAFSRLAEVHPQLLLVIVGEEAKNAMQAAVGIKSSIVAVIKELDLEDRVIFTGSVDDVTLSSAFYAADLFVFPVLDLPNDVEGFGMVAIEAAAHGLPTIAFAVGGVPDAVAEGDSGWLVEPGNYEKMNIIISKYLESPAGNSVSCESCELFSAQFRWEAFEEKLNSYLVEALE